MKENLAEVGTTPMAWIVTYKMGSPICLLQTKWYTIPIVTEDDIFHNGPSIAINKCM